MRVAYVVSYYPAVSVAFILREVTELRSQGIEVDTFTVRRSDEGQLLSEADREADRTTVALVGDPLAVLRAHLHALRTAPRGYLATLAWAVRRGSGARGRLWQVFYFAEAMVLWAHCRRLGTTHIHTHFANNGSDISRIAARFDRAVRPSRSLRWTFTMHGPTEFADVSRYGVAGKILDADLVVCISDFCRSQLMELVPADNWDRLVVVRCGVDPERFRPAAHAPLVSGPLRVLSIGQLAARKGHSLLIDAIAALGARGVDVELVVVGDGPERGALEDLAKRLGVADRVRLVGAVGQDDILEWYASTDAFCLPSFAEGVPVVLMEAMACALPVVSTWIAGTPELVADGETGLLVAPGRADQLADALAALAADPGRRRLLGEAAREVVMRRYDLARNAAELKAHFERLAWTSSS